MIIVIQNEPLIFNTLINVCNVSVMGMIVLVHICHRFEILIYCNVCIYIVGREEEL